MRILKKGDNGEDVKTLQNRLKKVLNTNISADGDFGATTEKYVKQFQTLWNIQADGIAGVTTQGKLQILYEAMFINNSKLLNFGKRRFVVFVDAGHWGIDDRGEYAKTGKFYKHQSGEVHERGYFYEGYENRIVAEEFIEQLTALGIMAIRVYHPFKEVSLDDRTEQVRAWLKRGYYGYLVSFHSNAIDTKNEFQKLENTVGFMVFTLGGNTFSDKIASEHWKNANEEIGAANWNFRAEKSDGDVDYEANFAMLRKSDLPEYADCFGAILEEWGFYTSQKDSNFIINSREKRVKAAVKTALFVKKHFEDESNI